MNLVGDPVGLEELRKFRENRKEFLKFLITEAKTSLSRTAEFRGEDGRCWRLNYDAKTDQLSVGIAQRGE